MSYNNLNNPLLNDKVIQRDYGLSTSGVDEQPIIKNEIEQPVELGEAEHDIDNSSIDDEIQSEVEPPTSDLGDLSDLGFDIKSMTFEDEDEEEDEPDLSNPTTVKPDNAAVKSLASVITGIVAEYAPKLASFPAKQPIGEIQEAVTLNKLPIEFVSFFENQNQSIEESLKLTDTELKELRKAFIAYMKTKDIETVSEGHALALQLGVIGIRLAVTSVQARAERIKTRDAIFEKYNIKLK